MRQHKISLIGPVSRTGAGIFVCIVVFLTITPVIQGQSGAWSLATVLSTGGEGWQSSAAIDARGNSVAIWDERTTNGLVVDRIWGRFRRDGGQWLPRDVVSRMNPPLQGTYVFPAVRTSASGQVTAIWSDYDGVSTADAVKGQWSAPQVLLPGVTSPTFLMNSRGDALLIWGYGGPRFEPNYVYAMRRLAGGTWGQQETVISAPHVTYDGVILAENGDALVTWETYDSTCSLEKCQTFNYAMHVSRETRNGNTWDDSGILTGPETNSHWPRIAADPTGAAAVLYAGPSGALFSKTQPGAGQPWTAGVQVYTSFDYWNGGLASDRNGIVTIVALDRALNKVVSIRGSLKTNKWTNPIAISGNDANPTQVLFGMGSNGAAVAVWLSGDPNYSTALVRAAVVPGSRKPWETPTSISPGLIEMPGPESVAVNATGKAVVTFSAFDSKLRHVEYAVSYTP